VTSYFGNDLYCYDECDESQADNFGLNVIQAEVINLITRDGPDVRMLTGLQSHGDRVQAYQDDQVNTMT